jgi:ring-1,2-phenylacetyl-CoA epoxidase subunit PaaB
MNTMANRFEVFQQDRPDRPHQNCGSVHAPDAELALLNARDVFARRPQCINLWVVPAGAILARTAQELAENPLDDEPTTPGATTLETYLVFQKQSQRRAMTYVSHVGEVEAPSPLAALRRAIAQFGSEGVFVWWVCPASAVARTAADDIESMFLPAHNKTYRQPSEYRTVTQMKQILRQRETTEEEGPTTNDERPTTQDDYSTT